MNSPLACIFEANKMGNKEISWSGLNTKSYFGYIIGSMHALFYLIIVNARLAKRL